MSWFYELISGRIYSATGDLIGIGYSGALEYKNRPDATSLHNLGPIPVGGYAIGEPRDTVTHGPYVLPLDPSTGNIMFDRFGFLIHGDSVISPGFSSEGCIILSRDIREKIWTSGDRELEVLATIPNGLFT
jgi:hypothetical protein